MTVLAVLGGFGTLAVSLGGAAADARAPAPRNVSARVERAAEQLPAAKANPGAELVSLRSRTTQTFKADGGSYETRVFGESVNYRDEQGAWQPVDNRLRRQGGELRNGPNRYELAVPRDLADGETRISSGDAWIAFSPRGAAGAARARGSRASFAQAWPGVELVYTAAGDAVREEIVVNALPFVRNFAFDVRLPLGFDLEQREDGGLVVKDQRGTVRLLVAPSTMIDARGARRPATSALRRGVNGWVLEISPDRTWLAARERRWPVTIDPQVSLPDALACSIAYDELFGVSESCGDVLPIGERCADRCQWNRALVRFDFAGALPAGAVVEHAALADTTGAPLPPAYQMTAAWTAAVTWEDRGDGTPWSSDVIRGGAEGDYVDVPLADVTPLVRDWLSRRQPNHGVLFKDPSRTNWGDNILIDPYLAIQYSLTDDPDGAVQLAAIASYEETDGLTAAEALRRLRIQDRFNNTLDDVVDEIASNDYGGNWVDDADAGKIKIGIKTDQPTPPSSKTDDARDVLADHDLLDDVKFVAVDWSYDDLEDQLDDFEVDFAGLLSQGKLELHVSPAVNAVAIDRANSLTPAELASFNAAVSGAAVRVVVTPINICGPSRWPAVSSRRHSLGRPTSPTRSRYSPVTRRTGAVGWDSS